jgi:hypothetical protein
MKATNVVLTFLLLGLFVQISYQKNFFDQLSDGMDKFSNALDKVDNIAKKAEDVVEKGIESFNRIGNTVLGTLEFFIDKFHLADKIKTFIMEKIKIQPVNLSFTAPIIGKVDATFQNLKVTKLDGEPKISEPQKKQVLVSLNKAGITASIDYAFVRKATPTVQDKGTANFITTGNDISVLFDIKEDLGLMNLAFKGVDFTNVLVVNSIKVKLGSIDFNVKGSSGFMMYDAASQLFELFEDDIKKFIEDYCAKQLPAMLNKMMKDELTTLLGPGKKTIWQAGKAAKDNMGKTKTNTKTLPSGTTTLPNGKYKVTQDTKAYDKAQGTKEVRDYYENNVVMVTKQESEWGLVSKGTWLPMKYLNKV